MRRFLLVAAMCGAASVAQAADMPDLPFLRGSFTEGLSTTAVNWEGFYIGGHAAYGASNMNFTDSGEDRSRQAPEQRRAGSSSSTSRMAAAWARCRPMANRLRRILRLQFPVERRRRRPRTELHPRQVRRLQHRQPMSRFVPVPGRLRWRDAMKSLAADEYLRQRDDPGPRRLRRRLLPALCVRRHRAGAGRTSTAAADVYVTISTSARCARLPDYVPSRACTDDANCHLIYGYAGGLGIDVMLVAGLFLRAEWEYRPLHVVESTPASTRCAPASATNSDRGRRRRSGRR